MTTNFSPDHSLTPTQHLVLNQLADGSSISAAAASAGIHRNTIRNWRRSVPEFARELDAATREQSLHWHEEVVALAPKAIDILCTILHNEAATVSQKLRAATIILKMAIEPRNALHQYAQTNPPELEALTGELSEIQHHIAQDAQFLAQQPIRKPAEPGRNSICPCHSGLKYKRCCANRPPDASGILQVPVIK